MIENIHEHMFGTDASNEISLLEYGLLVAPARVVNPDQQNEQDEYFCVYRYADGYDTGFKRESELDALMKGEDWASQDDIDSQLNSLGITLDEWLEQSFVMKLSDSLLFGVENIMGSSYDIMSRSTAIARYLGPEYEEGEFHLLLSEAHGIYIPQVFAKMYGNALVPNEGCEGMIEQDLGTLEAGPDEEEYWDAMEEIERNAKMKIGDKLYDIEQNGDLWAYETGKLRPEGHGE